MSISQTDLLEARRALLAKQLQKARAGKKQTHSIGRRPEGETIPLSFAQQRMWFLHQWDPDNPAYNVPVALRVEGALDVTALCQALNEIVRRHQVLQMTYVMVDEDPVQVPHPEPSLALVEVNLSALSPDERETEMQRLIATEIGRPFDLAHDLPIRTTLLHLDETEHVLLMTIHHIATDGWSMGVFVKELALLYKAFCSGQPSPLPELAIQYADFAYWQRNWLQGKVLEKQMAYWKKHLAGAPEVLDLPTDRPRPPVRTYEGAIHPFRLSPSLTQAIRDLSRQKGSTLFMTLLAAFQVLLFRYTGQRDIVVGTPIANRNRPEIEDLIGFFINTLVMRTDLSGNPTFSNLLAQVQEVALEAYAHQDLPFERLVDEMQPGRDLSRSPIFQVMFVLQNIPLKEWDLPGLTLSSVKVDQKTAKFDLMLSLEDTDHNLAGAFEYNTDLFDAATLARMADHFQTLLEHVVAGPEQRISDLSLLTKAERHKLLTEWNDTGSEVLGEQCIHELFEAQVERTPDAAAVVFSSTDSGRDREQYLTYRELNRRANQLAHHLRGVGVGPEVLVGICVERSVEMLVGLLGILKAGGAYVPLDPAYPKERLAFILKDTQAPVLLTQSQLLSKLPAHQAQVICLDADWGTMIGMPLASPKRVSTASHLAYTIYTSGSTGQPKGVMITHSAAVAMLSWAAQTFPPQDLVGVLAVTSICFDLSVYELFLPLSRGGAIILVEDALHLLNLPSRESVTLINAVPSAIAELIQAKCIPESARTVNLAGEPLRRVLVQQVYAQANVERVYNLYGPTEDTTYSTFVLVARDDPHEPTIGRPISNTRAYILGAELQPVPVGVVGELCLGGAGLSRGYLNRPGLTAEKFLPDPFSREPGTHLYRTGDLGRYLPDGSIEFLGRVDYQVKVRGYRIELGEIEMVLGQHPGVREAVVVASPGEGLGVDKRLVAYVVPSQEQAPMVSDLRSFLKEKLPDYMVPSAFVTLETLPLTPNGKVDRRALPEPDDTRPELETAFVAPRNELEERIVAIWSEVLGIETIGIDDDFFDLGGESFKVIRVARKIGESVSVMDLFKHPTIRGLVGSLSQERAKSTGLLHELTKPVPAGERVISLVCIPIAGGNAIMYQPLASALPEGYSLYAVQLPGHDFGNPDQDLKPLEEVARLCVEEIKQDVAGPIALYGHCMGGALTIEIARLLEESDIEVTGVFIGGHFPSPRRLPGKFFELLEKIFPTMRQTQGNERSQFEMVRAVGGFTDELDPEEQAFVMRNYFHDSRNGLDYYTKAHVEREGERLKAPILSIIGQADRVTEFYEERFKDWEFFSDSVDLVVIPQAGHFFAKHQPEELAEIISRQLPVWQAKAAQASRPTTDAAALPAQAVTPNLNLFFLVALGQLISILGTGLAAFALDVWVLEQTGAVSAYALVTALTWLPGILLLPIAGALADRYDRRWIMILGDVVAICATLVIGLLFWVGALQIWHICVMVIVSSAANAFQRPAYAAAISQLVPKRYLGHVNGLVSVGDATGTLLAQLGGGVLVMTIGLGGVILIDVLTFLFAAATLLFVRFPDTLFRKQQEEPLLREVVKGWQYIMKRRGLVAMVGFFMGLNFLSSIVTVLVAPLVLSVGSPATMGAVNTIFGIGILVGGLVMGLWGGTKRRAEGILRFVMLFGLFSVVMGLRPSPIYPAIGFLGFGFSIAIVRSHWYALIQTKVGLYLQGRVIATSDMLSTAMMPLGQVVAGLLVDKVFEPLMAGSGPVVSSMDWLIGVGPGRGIGLLMILVGVIGQVWAILGYLYRPLRFMEDALPDAIPDVVISADKDELQELADRQLQAKGVPAAQPTRHS